MKDIDLEYYIELSYIVIHRETTKDAFMKEFSLSEYEYTNDIYAIEEMSKKYGLEIVVKKDKITCRISDEETFENYSRSFFTFYYPHRYLLYNNRELILSLEISKDLLWSDSEDDSVNIDELAERLNYSRSNLRRPLKISRSFLDSYSLEVANIPHHGLKVIGSELFKRKAMCAILNMIDINISNNTYADNKEEFMSLYRSDNYQKLMRIVNGVITRRGYEILPIEQRRIIYYLIIQSYRMKEGYFINEEFDDDTLEKDNEFIEMAEEINQRLGQEYGFEKCTKNELMSIVVMLYDSGIDPERVRKYVFDNSYDLYMKMKTVIDNYLLDAYGIQISTTRYVRYYEYILSRYTFKERFNFFQNMYQRFGGKSSLVYEYPLIKKTCFKIANELQEVLGHYVPKSQLIQLCELFAYVIMDKELVFPKLKLCITSRNNHFEPYLLKDLILNNISSKYVERLDVFNFFYITTHDQVSKQYDLILTDQLIGFTENKDIFSKFIIYKEYDGNIAAIENIIRNSRNIASKVLDEDCILTMDIDPKDNDDLLVLRNKIVEYTDINLSLKDFELKDGQGMKGSAVYIFEDYFAKRNVIIVGDFKHKCKINNKNVYDYVLFAGKILPDNIKIINALLYELVHDHYFFKKVYDDNDINDINRQLNEVLK